MRDEKGRYIKGHKQANTGRTQFKKGETHNWEVWNKGKTYKNPKLTKIMIGRKRSSYERQRIAEGKMGAKNPMWKGGVSPLHERIRHTYKYRIWRKEVLVRDGNKCIWCNSKEKLRADHIKPFSIYEELRFDVDNGRTLCQSCHEKTETYGWFLYHASKGSNL